VDSLKVGETRAHTNQCVLERHGWSIGCRLRATCAALCFAGLLC
jgi:hypothetical protein